MGKLHWMRSKLTEFSYWIFFLFHFLKMEIIQGTILHFVGVIIFQESSVSLKMTSCHCTTFLNVSSTKHAQRSVNNGKDSKKSKNVLFQRWSLLTQINVFLLYGRGIALLHSYSKELKICNHTKTCNRMFLKALLITAKTGKQPRYPSAGKCINCGSSGKWNIIQC